MHTEYKHKNIVTYVSVWLIIMYNVFHTIWKTLSCAIYAKIPSECLFNARNQASVWTIYYTEATNQANSYAQRDDYYGRGLGQGGCGWFGGQVRGWPYYYNCWKYDHISLDCPMKHRINLKLCNICGVGDHSLEEFPIVLDKIMTIKNLNLLHTVSKEEVLNSNNLNIITRPGSWRDIKSTTLHDQQRRKDSFFPNPNKEEKIMKESIIFFKQNTGIHNEDILQEFLQLLQENQLVGWLLEQLNILKGQRPSKDARQLSYKHKYYDPRVDV